MGWSCTVDADTTMVRIEQACERTRQANGLERSSNVFFANGKCYFYEITRRDQTDGGIAGTINLSWSDANGDWCRKVGMFRIDGRGRVVRGPALFKLAADSKAPVGW